MSDMLVRLYDLSDSGPYLSQLAEQGIIVRRAMAYEKATVKCKAGAGPPKAPPAAASKPAAKKPVSKTPASAPSEDVLDDFPAPPKGKPPAKLMV